MGRKRHLSRSGNTSRRARALACLVACVGLFCSPEAGAADAGALERVVKATYLYKFAPFVQWPENLAAQNAPMTVCIVGRDPFGPVLDQAVAGQRVENRNIVVRRTAVATRDAGCQIMYLGGSQEQSVADAIAAVRGAPVLTITDANAANAIIRFVIDNNRVRFDIDEAAAAENGLMISSQLLNLAHAVRPRA
jgi:hypothetical protein